MSWGEHHRRVIVQTRHWAKPGPTRDCDWEATLDSWEPGDPIGYGRCESDAVCDLFCCIEDLEQDDEERYRHETKQERDPDAWREQKRDDAAWDKQMGWDRSEE